MFSRRAAGEATGIWIAPSDGASPPRLVASGGENTPHFGPRGEIVFRYAEKNFNYVGRMNRDGTGRSKIAAFPISTFQAFSPDRAWVVAIVASADSQRSGASALVSTRDGTRHPLCARVCAAAWAPDGKYLYLTIEPKSRAGPGQSVALPVRADTGLPDLADGGFEAPADALEIPGARRVPQADIVPGLDPSTYAYVTTTTHRNLFRVRLP